MVVIAAFAAAAVQAAPPGVHATSQPAETAAGLRVSLHLDLATPQQAFDALGRAAGCRFALVDGAAWVGQGVPVTLSVEHATFWDTYRDISRQTGYQLVYRSSPQPVGDATLTLHRVDVPAEQTPADTVAAGPLLVRPRRAYVSVPLDQAKRQLVPTQVAVEVELFVEPGIDAVYVSAAALRATDGDGRALARAGDLDPLAAVAGGQALLQLHFDAPAGLPAAVGSWQALLRLGVAGGRDELRLPLELLQADAAPAATGQELPTTRRARVGGLDVLVDPPRLTLAASHADGRPDGRPEQFVSLGIEVPRGRVDALDWSRAYSTLAATPPDLDGEGLNWTRTSAAVLALPSAVRPGEAAAYRVYARFSRVSQDVPSRAVVRWCLPSTLSETRELVRWPSPLPVEAKGRP